MTSAYLIAVFLSLLVAVAELLSKFKDEPFKIIGKNPFAWFYILFNVIIGAVSLYLLYRTNLFGTTEYDLIKAAFTAGLGSTVLMRSKFFKTQFNGKDIAIGPEFIINVFLETLETMIDRDRALERKNLVEKHMSDIDFSTAKDYVITTILASSQTHSPEVTKEIMEEADKIEKSQMSDIDKSYALGYLIMDYMGERFLKEMFKNNSDRFKSA
jgi:hypothetical protein